ncbi:hypothetical protein C8R46DRAFT_72906 [Mycena filopes]|nr:hypothetical protein C8R46DRAFT_72906 [Mycena filopes]
MPLPDPRAQFIISQAMHQLSTLFTAPWPVQPATPPRHPSSAPKFSFSPHTPRHPFIFDSSASPGTLPTSSPPSLESSSRSFASSPLHRHGRTAKASLVPRSRSRGRHVSFQDDDVVGRRQRPARRQADDSGSFLELRRDSSGSCDLSEARIDVRPRARTPGPPVSPPSARRRHSGVASKTRDPI